MGVDPPAKRLLHSSGLLEAQVTLAGDFTRLLAENWWGGFESRMGLELGYSQQEYKSILLLGEAQHYSRKV